MKPEDPGAPAGQEVSNGGRPGVATVWLMTPEAAAALIGSGAALVLGVLSNVITLWLDARNRNERKVTTADERSERLERDQRERDDRTKARAEDRQAAQDARWVDDRRRLYATFLRAEARWGLQWYWGVHDPSEVRTYKDGPTPQETMDTALSEMLIVSPGRVAALAQSLLDARRYADWCVSLALSAGAGTPDASTESAKALDRLRTDGDGTREIRRELENAMRADLGLDAIAHPY